MESTKLQMFVDLIIPDTTAITARQTLHKIGYDRLADVKRSDYYLFTADSDNIETTKQNLAKTDILVNANKHRCRILSADDKLPSEETELKGKKIAGIKVLVKDLKQGDGMLSTLKDRLGLGELIKVEKGTVWTLFVDADSKRAMQLAKEMTEALLYNRHYQKYEFVG